MLDARKDSASIKAVYEKLESEGVEMNDSFVQQYNQIMRKYTDPASHEAGSPTQVRCNITGLQGR